MDGDDSMDDAGDMRRRARHCIDQADQPGTSPLQQLALLQMATRLLEIADHPDRIGQIDDALPGTKDHPDS